MTVWAHVRSGLVVATSDGLTPPTDDLSLLVGVAPEADVQPGDTYDGQAFTPGQRAPVRVPSSVTMRQARLALHGAGLLSSVQGAIDSLVEPAKTAALIEWEYSNEVQRRNGVVSALAPALGLTEAQIDALFIAAAGL